MSTPTLPSISIGDYTYFIENKTLMYTAINKAVTRPIVDYAFPVKTIDSDLLFRIEKAIGFDFNHNRIFIS
jgi:hypothetical protein